MRFSFSLSPGSQESQSGSTHCSLNFSLETALSSTAISDAPNKEPGVWKQPTYLHLTLWNMPYAGLLLTVCHQTFSGQNLTPSVVGKTCPSMCVLAVSAWLVYGESNVAIIILKSYTKLILKVHLDVIYVAKPSSVQCLVNMNRYFLMMYMRMW